MVKCLLFGVHFLSGGNNVITKVMGFALFLVGLFLLVLSVLALLEMVGPFNLGERLLMFFGGLILCVLGFIMARDRTSRFEE